MTNQEDENAQPAQLPMVPDRIREGALAELDRLQTFVRGLDAATWSRPSAAAGWSIGDVVTHLSLAMRVQSQLLDAAAAGKGTGGMWKAVGNFTRTAVPAVAPAINAVNNAIPKLIDRTLTREAVLSQFDTAAGNLRTRLDRVGPGDYSREITYVGGPWPLSFFLAHILNELAVHGWDMATTLDPQARLSNDARTVLPWYYWSGTPFMLRPPAGLEGTVFAVLSDPDMEMWCRVSRGTKEQGMGQPAHTDARLTAESGTFVLALAGRIKPLDALRFAAVQTEGNDELARGFLGAWHIL